MSDTAKSPWIVRVLGFDRPRPGSVQRRDVEGQLLIDLRRLLLSPEIAETD